MDPDETFIQYVKSHGEELCIKKEFDIGNGLAVNWEKLIRRTTRNLILNPNNRKVKMFLPQR